MRNSCKCFNEWPRNFFRQGLKIIKRIIVAKNSLKAVTPSAPIVGNRLFANEAPLCIDIIAHSNNNTGNSVLRF
ncbi:hypothetical protein [Arsenophonus sp. PmNCSU2021_1]|uniref:hypothetical protein n=1 Tax=Arsenophonus sp. PmNCSU2021_1 TaxID=3118989 RepID=UPI003FA5AC00